MTSLEHPVESMDLGRLNDSVSMTVGKLKDVLSGIGYDADETSRHIAMLNMKAKERCNKAISGAHQTRDQIVEAIDFARSSHGRICQEVGHSPSFKPESCRDGSLLEILEFEKNKLESIENLKGERISILSEVLGDLHEAHDVLGMQTASIYSEIGSDLSLNHISSAKKELQNALSEIQNRRRTIAAVVTEIAGLLKALAVDEASICENAIDSRVLELIVMDTNETVEHALDVDCLDEHQEEIIQQLVHSKLLTRLETRRQELLQELHSRQEKLRVLAQQVISLWKRLDVPEDHQHSFFGQHRGFGLATIKACETELTNLEICKQKLLDDLCTEAFHKLENLWNVCKATAEEQKTFLVQLDNEASDRNLGLFEEEVAKMDTRHQQIKPILNLVEKRKRFQDDKKEYEVAANDPERFKIPRRMLQLEKMRKRIKKLPEIEKELILALAEWEKEHGELQIEGIQDLKDQVDAIKEQKDSPKTLPSEQRVLTPKPSTKSKSKLRKPNTYAVPK